MGTNGGTSWADSRLTILVGGFGSGKSELAVNLALRKAGSEQVHLVDMDIINAYFRVRDLASLLISRGVMPVLPPGPVLHGDLPIAGEGVGGLLQDPGLHLVLDVGGDDLGATALASVRHLIMERDYRMVMVVNPFRPFTGSTEGILRTKDDIERRSGLSVYGIVSNPNLGLMTSTADIIEGHQIVKEGARAAALPILGLAVKRRLAEEAGRLFPGISVLPLDLYFTPSWLGSQKGEEVVA